MNASTCSNNMTSINTWIKTHQSEERSVIFMMIMGYLLLTILCCIILVLPWTSNIEQSFIDHLFIAVSVVSTTGLSSIDFSSTYNTFAHASSLIFIQLGGIGYMALSSMIILNEYNRMPRLSTRLLRLEFNLPQKYPLLDFVYSVAIFTVLIETMGAFFLYFGFKEAGIENPLWYAVFHSISAFCTAGFSLFSDSLSGFKEYPMITNTITVLSLLGSIGFIVLLDFIYRITGKRKSITLTSKIIISSTFMIWIFGSVMLYISNTDGWGQGWNGIKNVLFQCMSAHTTVGFNTTDLSLLNPSSILIMICLMLVGASPSGTGGGIKTTSISASFAVLKSILTRSKNISFFGREIPSNNVYLAISVFISYLVVMISGFWILLCTDGDQHSFASLFFEVVSALSTVGLSTGITGDLSQSGKLMISLLMFIGRIGVLTFGLALIAKAPLMRTKCKIEDIAL